MGLGGKVCLDMRVRDEFSEGSQEGERNVQKGREVAFYTWGTSQCGLATVQVCHSHSPSGCLVGPQKTMRELALR